MMRKFLLRMVSKAVRFVYRLLQNKPVNPYEKIVFNSLVSAHDELRSRA